MPFSSRADVRAILFRPHFFLGRPDRAFSGQNSRPDSIFRNGPATLFQFKKILVLENTEISASSLFAIETITGSVKSDFDREASGVCALKDFKMNEKIFYKTWKKIPLFWQYSTSSGLVKCGWNSHWFKTGRYLTLSQSSSIWRPSKFETPIERI